MNNNNIFNLTVEQKPNQLNNIKLVEYVNTNILHKLIHSNLLSLAITDFIKKRSGT